MSRLTKRSSALQKIAQAGHRKAGAPKKRIKPYTPKTLNFDDDLWRDLIAFSQTNDCSITEIIHKGMREFLIKNEN